MGHFHFQYYLGWVRSSPHPVPHAIMHCVVLVSVQNPSALGGTNQILIHLSGTRRVACNFPPCIVSDEYFPRIFRILRKHLFRYF